MRAVVLLASLLLVGVPAFAAKAETVVLDVRNMTCSLCPVTVKKSLEKVPGVAQARVDYDRKTATVTFDAEKTSTGALTKATTDAGFPSSTSGAR